MATHEKWAERQIRVMLECGVSLANAQAAIAFALKQIPATADPQTFILDAARLEQNISDEALIADARNAWYAADHIPLTYKRILDARSLNATR